MQFSFDNDEFGFGWNSPNPENTSNNESFTFNEPSSPFNFINDFENINNKNNVQSPPPEINDSPLNPQISEILTQQATTHHRRTPSTPSQLQQINILNLFTQSQIAKIITASQNIRQKSLPVPQIQNVLSSADQEFKSICQDPDVKFNPHALGFIPHTYWPDKQFTFGELVTDFFQRKNNSNARFYHKLYNALKIIEDDPFYIEFVGIEWVNEKVLKVDKNIFARLLGIKTIDGSLFHQQGNFPSHGFVELGSKDCLQYVTESDLEGVDFDKVRLLVHQNGVFTKGCTESSIEQCKWISSRKRQT
ncbi:hypothetical protein GPJ56_002888 [Histomonas meleagridis]|uniref:uncharacterized protein n=1 Tax=Histomonas meleagridis TaxID=135588 RepID=UPI0035595714|nr:hypothetical protein GPJ56_002888 [Histomonas meleagridis]KAH0800411.1 hypothetical protein GO595_006822 [Histomonas meleagridis]